MKIIRPQQHQQQHHQQQQQQQQCRLRCRLCHWELVTLDSRCRTRTILCFLCWDYRNNINIYITSGGTMANMHSFDSNSSGGSNSQRTKRWARIPYSLCGRTPVLIQKYDRELVHKGVYVRGRSNKYLAYNNCIMVKMWLFVYFCIVAFVISSLTRLKIRFLEVCNVGDDLANRLKLLHDV